MKKICIVLILVLVFLQACGSKPPSFSADIDITIDGNIVDNNYNNYISGGYFCRIGDKLYLNNYDDDYDNAGKMHGLFEISSTKINKIFVGKKIFDMYQLYNLYCYKDNIYGYGLYDYSLGFISGDLKYDYSLLKFNFSSKKYDVKKQIYNKLMTIENIGELDQLYNNFIYFYNDSYYRFRLAENDKYVLEKETNGIILLDGMEKNHYFYNDTLYYTKSIDLTVHLYSYNLSTGENKEVINSDDFSFFNTDEYYVENNYLIYSTYNKIFIFNMDDNSLIEISDSNNKIYTLNVFDEKIYYEYDSALYVYNIRTSTSEMLCEKSFSSAYITDDKWIYLKNNEKELWRIEQKGENLEKIFDFKSE